MKIKAQLLGVVLCLAMAGCLHAQSGRTGGLGGFGGTGGIQAPTTPQLQILTTSLPPATIGTLYSQTLQAAFGVGALTWSETGALPAGLSFNSSTGAIFGTPSNNAGVYAFTVTVMDSSTPPQVARQNLSISLLCTPLQLTSPPTFPPADQGTAYNYTIQTAGGIAPLGFTATNLPTGEGINSSTGVISGTPSVNGTFSNIGITVTDSCPLAVQSVSGTFTEQVNAALAITTQPPLQQATTGSPYSTQFNASGGTPAYAWSVSAGSLPAGLSINSGTGVVSGTPTGVGTSTFTITVTDSLSATASVQYTITVACAPLSITTPNLPNGTQNVAYSFQEQFQGGDLPVTFSASGLPAPLVISAPGLISGTPIGFGTFTPTITATDSCPVQQTANVTPTLVIAQQTGTLQITTTSPLPDEIVGQAVSFNMAAQGGVPPYTWALSSGAFPTGSVGMNAAGLISGTPTTAGTYTPNIQVTDTQPVTAGPLPFSITVTCPAESITTTSLPPATKGTAYSFTVQGSGGVNPFTWGASGLPTGLAIASGTGVISGTPSVSGTFSVTITRTDSCLPSGTVVSVTIPLQVNNPPLAITTTSLPNGTQNQPYSATLSATGGTPPYTWAITAGTLQTGLSLNSSTGVISGTPTQTSTVSLTFQVTDSAAHTATTTLPLTVLPATGADNRYCNASGKWTGPATKGPASAPQLCVYTPLSATPSPGATVNVTAGSCSSLQSAINSAVAGQTIVIPALNGATQDVINCTIKPAAIGNASNWITVTTDQTGSLPPEGTRLTPGWAGIPTLIGRPGYGQPGTAGTYIPKLIATGNFAIQFQTTAAYWRFIGIEVTSPSGQNATQLVQLAGTGPNHIILDRLDIHGGNSLSGQDRDDIQSGVAFGSCSYCALIDSFVYDTHCGGTCTQSQGVGLGGNATVISGPVKVVDNYIESAGENIFSGGNGAPPPAVIQPASDDEIRRNFFFKPLFWRTSDPNYFGKRFELDNLMELKNSQRTWIEGNIFANSTGTQGTQQGNAIIFGPRNQSNQCCSGTASSDGAGTITFVSGTPFDAGLTSPNCGVLAGHCLFFFNNLAYQVATFTSTTQVTLQLCGSDCSNSHGGSNGTTLPPAGTGSFLAFDPGLNPNAVNNDIIFINNYITGAARVGAIATAVSDGGDLPLSLKRIFIQNNAADYIDGYYWNNKQTGACCVWATGWQIQGANSTLFPDSLVIDHNTFLEFLTGGNPGLGPDFMWGLPGGQQFTSFQVTNNISSGGVNQGVTAKAAVTGAALKAGLCWDHNFLATLTRPLGPNGNSGKPYATGDNPPYPAATDSGGCGFTATGNTNLADFNAFQFTNLNGAVSGNYQLQVTSPGHNAASDGTDAGVNWNTLQAAISGVGGIVGTSPNWQLVNTPTQATLIDNFAIKQTNNHWFLADRNTGIWVSTNQGSTWTQSNTGLPTADCTSLGGTSNGVCGWTLQVNPHTGDIIANLAGPSAGTSHYYRSTNEGTSWTQIPEPVGFSINRGSFSGPLMPPAGGGTMVLSGAGASGGTVMYSTNDGTATTLSTENPLMGNAESTGLNGSTYGAGGENGGFQTSPTGASFTAVWNCQPTGGPLVGPACGNVLDSTEIYSQITDGSGNWVISTRTGVWKSGGPASAPTSWTHLYTSTARDRAVFRDSLGTYYFGQAQNATNFTVVRSIDGGKTWQEWDTGIGTGLEAHQFLENTNDGKIYSVIENGSTNTGALYSTPK